MLIGLWYVSGAHEQANSHGTGLFSKVKHTIIIVCNIVIIIIMGLRHSVVSKVLYRHFAQ